MKKQITCLVIFYIIISLVLVSIVVAIAEEDIIWDSSSINIVLSEDTGNNEDFISNELIDWDNLAVILGIIGVFFIAYWIIKKNSKKVKTKKSKKKK